MVDATFNNISVYMAAVNFFMEEIHRENHWSVSSYRQTLSHKLVSSTPHYEQQSKSLTVVVLATDCLFSDIQSSVLS